MKQLKINFSEIVNATILMALGSWILWYTSDFPTLQEGYSGPALFPRIIAYGFLLCGIILCIPGQTASKNNKTTKVLQKKRIGILISGLLLVSIFPFIQSYLYFVSKRSCAPS